MEDVTGAEDMIGVAGMKIGVKGTTGAGKGAEATKSTIRSEGGRRVVILVIKTTTRPCRQAPHDNFRFRGRHKNPLFAGLPR